MNQIYNLYIISDGTGETAINMMRAALVHFHDKEVNIIRCKNVRTEQQVSRWMDEVEERQGFLVYTVVSPKLREKIRSEANTRGFPAIDLLGNILDSLEKFFGGEALVDLKSGRLRVVDEQYFKRIEAIEFTVKHDDGKDLRGLDEAEIVLVGISRTSKTPLSIFLSHKGWKVINIPIVKGVSVPEELKAVDQKKIIGLSIRRDKLQAIRRNRLQKFLQDPGGDYASLKHIHEEIEYAEQIFKENRRWPVFDVTDSSLEETSSEIVRIISSRTGIKKDYFS
ncbi:MAG: pyruvate, water dikinase regulatory protein [Bdellovibrionales bacterium]